MMCVNRLAAVTLEVLHYVGVTAVTVHEFDLTVDAVMVCTCQITINSISAYLLCSFVTRVDKQERLYFTLSTREVIFKARRGHWPCLVANSLPLQVIYTVTVELDHD